MKKFLPILLLIAVGSYLLSSVFHPGFMYSHDSLWHVERFMNMKTMLSAGQFPVRWSAGLDHEYGVPLFNYTYPLPYYLGATLMFAGLGPVKVYNLLLLVFYLLGGLGFYFLAKGGWKGIGAALLYFLAPYVFLDIFVRGALGEVAAMAIFPWSLVALKQIEANKRMVWYAPIPLALLILSHDFYGLLFAALLVFLVIFSFQQKKKALLSILLSFCLSGFFIVPALGEKGYLATPANGFQYVNHFVYPQQLLYSPWSYIGSFPGPDPIEMSYQLGFANWIILGLAIVALIFLRKLRLKLVWYLIPILVSLFLTLPLSGFVWKALPPLQVIQFPWRFLGIAISVIPLLFIGLVEWGGKSKTKLLKIATLLILALAFYNVRNYRRPVEWFDAERFQNLHYLYFDSTTTAHRDEIVPRWAAAERFIPAPPAHVTGQSANISDITLKPLSVTFTATSENNQATAIVYRNYFPSWQGRADGKTVTISPTKTGEINVTLLPGRHTYKLFVASTPLERISNLITLVTILVLIAISIRSRRAAA